MTPTVEGGRSVRLNALLRSADRTRELELASANEAVEAATSREEMVAAAANALVARAIANVRHREAEAAAAAHVAATGDQA